MKGTHKGKQITAVLIPGTNTIQRFQYDDNPGNWYFPLIKNGKNVYRDEFQLFDVLEGEPK